MIEYKGPKSARTHLRLNMLSALALAVIDVKVEARRSVPTTVPCTPREDQLTGLTHAMCLITTPAKRKVDLSGSAQAYEARRFGILSQAIPTEERASPRVESSAQRHGERVIEMGGTLLGVVTSEEEQRIRDRMIEMGVTLPGRITEREEKLIQEREGRIARMQNAKKNATKKPPEAERRQKNGQNLRVREAADELQSRRDYADWLERYVAGEDEQNRRTQHLERQQMGLSGLLSKSRANRRQPLSPEALSAQEYLRRNGMAACPVEGKCRDRKRPLCVACVQAEILRECRAEERRRLDATETPREARIRRALNRVRARLSSHKLRHADLMAQHASGDHIRSVRAALSRMEKTAQTSTVAARRMKATEQSVPNSRVYRIEVPAVRLSVGRETWHSPARVLHLDVSTLDAEQLTDLDYLRTLTVNPVSWAMGIPRSKGRSYEAAWANLMRAMPAPVVIRE